MSGLLEETDDLQPDHRQDTRHDIEDHPAEKGEEQVVEKVPAKPDPLGFGRRGAFALRRDIRPLEGVLFRCRILFVRRRRFFVQRREAGGDIVVGIEFKWDRAAQHSAVIIIAAKGVDLAGDRLGQGTKVIRRREQRGGEENLSGELLEGVPHERDHLRPADIDELPRRPAVGKRDAQLRRVPAGDLRLRRRVDMEPVVQR